MTIIISKKLNDWMLLLIGNPLLGIIVPSVCGFTTFVRGIDLFYIYLCFTLISTILWTGNSFIHYLLRRQLYKIKNIAIRLPLRYSITFSYTWVASYILLTCWNHFIQSNRFSPNALITAQWIMVAISLLISNIYEIVYLSKERESDLVRIERTEKSKVQAQLDALKSQIDPHFIFNSLNTLSYLITHDQIKAKLFNDTLAKVYRYILSKKENDLVLLKEEIEFASNYFYLLKIRYQQGLSMTIEMETVITDDYYSPPLSLQLLIENAIKHNHFSETAVLNINIKITEYLIVISNNISQKRFELPSSKIGLYNLGERYKLITNKSISIEQTDKIFTVKLPVVKS